MIPLMGSSPHVDNRPSPFQQAEFERLQRERNDAQNQAITATQQNIGGINLDWLKQYGQTSAMAVAGIGAPFSAISGGFSTPFLKTSGAPLSGAASPRSGAKV